MTDARLTDTELDAIEHDTLGAVGFAQNEESPSSTREEHEAEYDRVKAVFAEVRRLRALLKRIHERGLGETRHVTDDGGWAEPSCRLCGEEEFSAAISGERILHHTDGCAWLDIAREAGA